MDPSFSDCVVPEVEHLGEELRDDVHGLAPEEDLRGGGALPLRPHRLQLPRTLDGSQGWLEVLNFVPCTV